MNKQKFFKRNYDDKKAILALLKNAKSIEITAGFTGYVKDENGKSFCVHDMTVNGNTYYITNNMYAWLIEKEVIIQC